ncbi:MAG: TIGR03086 family metal-binding protein [Actinomycetota bacterium]|nr:TIGR03086 family metal-binding protein [Actinomycetota bacterium]
MSLGTRDAYRRAAAGFDSLVKQIGDEQWAATTPCSEWDVRALVGHLVYEDLWAVPLFAGQTIEQVGDRLEGDNLGDDPRAAWDRAYADAMQAISDDDVMARKVHLSYGEETAENYAFQLFLDHLVHGWDLARGIGANDRLEPELVDHALGWVQENQAMLQGSGAFGSEVEVPPDADEQTKLLAALGRTG